MTDILFVNFRNECHGRYESQVTICRVAIYTQCICKKLQLSYNVPSTDCQSKNVEGHQGSHGIWWLLISGKG